jgi:hypothetical protein
VNWSLSTIHNVCQFGCIFPPDACRRGVPCGNVCPFAVGHNTSGDWAAPDAEDRVTRVFTNPLPMQEVEKLGADINNSGVELGMAALAWPRRTSRSSTRC